MSDDQEQYDAIADTFIVGKSSFFEHEKDFAREYILERLQGVTGIILDIGCGAGEDTAVFEKLPETKVFGIDPSQKMVDAAKVVVAHPDNFRVGEYEDTGFPDASVDCVVARFSLHYVENIDSAYTEMARILRPGGKLIEVVDHPLADTVEGEHFTKGGVPYVRIKLYKGTVTIEFPMHNISDYFSPTFFRSFDLLEMVEHTGTDREFQTGPNALAYTASRKRS